MQIRCEGMRLFLLWLQALQTNCAEEQLLIFACLVPGFPAVPSSRGPCTLDTIIYSPFSNPPDGENIHEYTQLPGQSQLSSLLLVMIIKLRSVHYFSWHIDTLLRVVPEMLASTSTVEMQCSYNDSGHTATFTLARLAVNTVTLILSTLFFISFSNSVFAQKHKNHVNSENVKEQKC